MTRLFLAFVLAVFSSPGFAADLSVTASDESHEDLALSIGRSALWPVSVSGSISVSNGSILRVADQGHTLKVTALKLGTAVVRSGFRQLQVNVIPEVSYRLYALIHEALQGRRGLSISAAGGHLAIVGRLLRADDWIAIANALGTNATTGQFSFQASVEPDVEAAIRAKLVERLRLAGLAHVDLRLSPEAVATVGVSPKDAKARAEKVLAPFGIRVDANSSVLALEPLVRVKILVAEIKKTFERRLGVSWPSSFSGNVLPDQVFPVGGLMVSLDAMESNGWGRVLASPNLLCRSGKEAQFMAGGEFPIRVSSIRASDVVWKNYGVMLRVKPLADLAGRMSIEIETEVSSIDNTLKTVEGIPGILTNKMQTHFDLTKTRTIALSGLLKNDMNEKSDGLPFLSTIPVLGSLFSSKDYQDQRSELVIFVTPEVLKPDDEALENAP